MKKSRLILSTLVLCFLCLCISGCMGKKEAEQTEVKTEKESAGAVEKSDLKADSCVIAVGETNVNFGEYNTYKYIMKNGYDATLGEGLWEYSINGKTIGQMAIEDCLRLIIQVKVMNKVAKGNNISLDIDEKADTDHNAKVFFDSLSEDIRTKNGISLEIIQKIYEENAIANKVYDVEAAKAVSSVNTDELNAARVLLIKLPIKQDNKDEVKNNATNLVSEAKKFGGNFYTFARQKTGKSPTEEIIGSMDSRANLEQSVLSMKNGAISDVIEESDAMYVAYCIDKGGKSVKEEYKNTVLATVRNDAFKTEYGKWSEQYEVRVSSALLGKE